jgi:hypothetical protein
MDTTKSDAAACGSYPAPDCSTLKEIAEKVCKNVPHDYIISLCMENGCAWVELEKLGWHISLPDSADKTIVEQLNDALCVANGFIESNTFIQRQKQV